MRQTSDHKILLTSSGDAIRAISFGYDFCAEQECGLNFRDDFCGKVKMQGKQGRAWTNIPQDFVWITHGDFAGFGFIRSYNEAATNKLRRVCASQLRDRGTDDMAAWDETCFVFLSKNKKTIGQLQTFFQKCKDLKVCFFPADKIQGTGMCLAVTSMMANEFKEIEAEDEAKQEAKAAFEQTKAKAKLDDLRKRCHEKGISLFYPCFMGALGASRFKENQERRYWLNDSRVGKPFGWMTDAQLCDYVDQLEKEFLGGK